MMLQMPRFRIPLKMKIRILCAVLSVACAAALLLPNSTQAQSFVFPNFSSTTGLKTNGNAVAPATGQDGTSQVLRLTSASIFQAGSAFSLDPVQLGSNASFSTAFS